MIAFSVQPAQSFSYIQQENTFAEIARKHGWEYTKMDEDPGSSSGPTWPGGHPGSDDGFKLAK